MSCYLGQTSFLLSGRPAFPHVSSSSSDVRTRESETSTPARCLCLKKCHPSRRFFHLGPISLPTSRIHRTQYHVSSDGVDGDAFGFQGGHYIFSGIGNLADHPLEAWVRTLWCRHRSARRMGGKLVIPASLRNVSPAARKPHDEVPSPPDHQTFDMHERPSFGSFASKTISAPSSLMLLTYGRGDLS